MKGIFKKYWWVIILALIYLIIFVWLLPEYYVYWYFQDLQGKDKLDAIKDNRGVAIQIGAGILALFGIYLTWRRTKALDKQNSINETNNNNNLVLQQFSKASELLSNEDNLSARLSGIYLFEKIMNENKEYYTQIIELLSAYIRDKRNNDKYNKLFSKESDHKYIEIDENKKNNFYETQPYTHRLDKDGKKLYENKYYYRVPIEKDIQAILNIFSRRNKLFEIANDTKLNLKEIICLLNKGITLNDEKLINEATKEMIKIKTIDLTNTNFYKANLNCLYLENIDFSDSHFVKSECLNTHFEFSYCICTIFDNANCNKTYFNKLRGIGTTFIGAHLYHTNFKFSHLMHVDFRKSIFNNVDLNFANCFEAIFDNALFFETDFKNIKSLNINNLSKVRKISNSSGLSQQNIKEIIKLNPNLEKDLIDLIENDNQNESDVITDIEHR